MRIFPTRLFHTDLLITKGQSFFDQFSEELTAANGPAPALLPVTVNETPAKTGNLLVPKKITAPTHDAAGNLANDGKWIYEWDSANRLRKMTPTPQALAAGFPNRTLEYVYDW